MKGLIEVGVGETIEFDGESYICVSSDLQRRSSCFICAFFQSDHCLSLQCISDQRKDKTGVYFVEQEGGGE